MSCVRAFAQLSSGLVWSLVRIMAQRGASFESCSDQDKYERARFDKMITVADLCVAMESFFAQQAFRSFDAIASNIRESGTSWKTAPKVYNFTLHGRGICFC